MSIINEGIQHLRARHLTPAARTDRHERIERPERAGRMTAAPSPVAAPASLGTATTASTPAPASASSTADALITITGRTFTVRREMADIFLTNAERAILAGDGSLVVLRHVDGVEMIPIMRTTPFFISAAGD